MRLAKNGRRDEASTLARKHARAGNSAPYRALARHSNRESQRYVERSARAWGVPTDAPKEAVLAVAEARLARVRARRQAGEYIGLKEGLAAAAAALALKCIAALPEVRERDALRDVSPLMARTYLLAVARERLAVELAIALCPEFRPPPKAERIPHLDVQRSVTAPRPGPRLGAWALAA